MCHLGFPLALSPQLSLRVLLPTHLLPPTSSPTLPGPTGSCTVEPGTNFLYSDLAVKEGVNSAIACCALCHTTPPCGAWTWGFSADRNKCFLKFKTGWSRDLDSKLTSGVVL